MSAGRKSYMKAARLAPYQKGVVPFWRNNEPGSLMTYSEETKDKLEKFKAEFDANVKYLQWVKKNPEIL